MPGLKGGDGAVRAEGVAVQGNTMDPVGWKCPASGVHQCQCAGLRHCATVLQDVTSKGQSDEFLGSLH